MKQRLAVLLSGTLVLWIIAAYPSQWMWGSKMIPQSLAAMALCLGPAALTLWLGRRSLTQSPSHQLLAMLGGMGLRMGLVLGLGVVLYLLVPQLKGAGFWIWLIVFYLFTLAMEMVLILTGKPAAAASQAMAPLSGYRGTNGGESA